MKQAIAVICSVCLLLTGCKNQKERDYAPLHGPVEAFAGDETTPLEDDATDESLQEPLALPGEERGGTRNRAVQRVQGLEALPADCLMGVKNYKDAMGWMEANAITALERYAVEPGYYFLIVPQYAGSSVTVEPLRLANGGVLVAGEATYHIDECPDDYALIVNNTMPEGAPDLQVTVTYGGVGSSYAFRYDGRGDAEYPTIQDGYFLVEAVVDRSGTTQKTVWGGFPADVDYGHVGFGHIVEYTALVPADWEYKGFVGGERERYQTDALQIEIWGFMDTESNYHTVTHFLQGYGNDVVERRTAAGNTVYRMEQENGNLHYSFELEDGLCVMVDIHSLAGSLPPSLRMGDCDDAVDQFRDSMVVEMRRDAYKSGETW